MTSKIKPFIETVNDLQEVLQNVTESSIDNLRRDHNDIVESNSNTKFNHTRNLSFLMPGEKNQKFTKGRFQNALTV